MKYKWKIYFGLTEGATIWRSVGDGNECENSEIYDETKDYVDSEDRQNKKWKEANKNTEISKKGKGKGKSLINRTNIIPKII